LKRPARGASGKSRPGIHNTGERHESSMLLHAGTLTGLGQMLVDLQHASQPSSTENVSVSQTIKDLSMMFWIR
jgi:hypothetical protein